MPRKKPKAGRLPDFDVFVVDGDDDEDREQKRFSMLQMIGQGLKTTADFMKDTVPSAVVIVGQIVGLIGKVHGIPL